MPLFKNDRITQQDIAILFRQLATLIPAGISLLNACTMLETNQKNALATLINRIKHDLLSGRTFSASLQRHPQLFNELICQLILISEHTGKLELTLEMIAHHLEQKLLFREQLLRALFYPCIIMITGLLITLSMLIFIVPRFEELFRDTPNSIPLLSQAIFALSRALRYDGWLLLPLLAIGYWLTRLNLKKYFYRLPVIKGLTLKIQVARFIRHLGITLNAGIPIANAMPLAITPGNLLLETQLKQLSRLVRSGTPLHRAMLGYDLFPPLVMQMIKTGEGAGQLDTALLKTADMLDTEIQRLLNRASQLLEPLIMIILGVLIGGLVIGMYLPLFKLGSII